MFFYSLNIEKTKPVANCTDYTHTSAQSEAKIQNTAQSKIRRNKLTIKHH